MRDSKSGVCPQVSVIIVNFNGGKLIAAAVRAALTTSLPLEIIVVDNRSSDNSLSLLRNLFGADPRVTIIPNRLNLGFARANNLGIANAKGRYLLLLNPDCVVYPDTIERVATAMKARPHVGLAGCLLLNPDGTEQAGCRRAMPTPWRAMVRVLHLDKLFPQHPRFRSFVLTDTPLPKGPVLQEALSGAFMMVHRKVLDEVGWLDERYFLHCEDLDWCARFQRAGWLILFVPDARAVHYKGYCSRDRPIFVLWHLHKGMVRFYRKFSRQQYPSALMLAVIAAVWARFFLLTLAHGVRKLVGTKGVDATWKIVEPRMAPNAELLPERIFADHALERVKEHQLSTD